MDLDYEYYDVNNGSFNFTDGNSMFSNYTFFRHYFVPPLLLLIGVVGLLGNGALVFILHKTNARSPPNALILSLALADLIVILFYMPFALSHIFPFGDLACKASEGLKDVSSGVTSITLVVLIVYSFFETSPTPQGDWSQRSTVVAVACVWALSVLFALPTFCVAHLIHVYEDESGPAICQPYDFEVANRHAPMKFVVHYVVPIMAFAFLYSIARLSGAVDRQTTARREVSKLTVWLFAVFAALLFPANMAASSVVHPDRGVEFWFLCAFAGFYLELAYRCVNPIVLYCVSPNFRQLFHRYLLCWRAKGNREPDGEAEMNRIRC